MNVDPKVREQLTFSRGLLTESEHQDSSRGPLRLLRDLMVAYGAAELALAAICVQLDCVPGKKDPCLPDYFDSLTQAMHLASAVGEMDYIAELHKVRSDSQLRFRLPDPGRSERAKEETLEHITGWCQQFLGLSLLDLDFVPTSSLFSVPKPAAALKQPGSSSGPVKPRYNCIGFADIRLAHRGQSEKGTIANLSVGGCYVNSELVPEVGDQVEMILQVNKMSFRVGGNVVHIPSLAPARGGRRRGSDSGMGVQFKEMSTGARGRLQELIAELKLKTNRMLLQAPN
jgi:Tfp pilus assembly protein PilZ